MPAASFADHATESLIRAGVILAAGIAAAAIVGVVIRRLVGRIVERQRPGGRQRERAETRSETIASILQAIARVAIGSMAALLILGEFGFDLAPLIAGAGIIGLAIGFGAQGLVADVVSGLFMLVEDQYGVGDWVDVGETSGTVEHMGLRTTRVRSLDGLLWTVRNGGISRTANANQGWGRAVIDVGVGYGTDLGTVQKTLKRVADEAARDPEHSASFLEAPEVWGVQELGDDAVTVRLVCKTPPGRQWAVARLVRLRVKEALDAEGVEIPFPQRTVWIRTEHEAGNGSVPLQVGDG